MTEIAIVGAGLAGLTAAKLLKNDCNVTVFEKARGLSGRMSTRRAEPNSFDHGAQYFTARTGAFKTFIAPLLKEGVIQRWNARHSEIDVREITTRQNWSEGEPRYVGVPGMNAIGRYLNQDIEVATNIRVSEIKRRDKWHVFGEDNEELGVFDWVISTAPAPQTAGLFPEQFEFSTELSAVKMLPCFAVMLGFDQTVDLGFDAAHINNSDLSWMANNASKPQRSAHSALIIHSSHQFANKHLELDKEQVMERMISEAEKITNINLSNVSYRTLHRWLYANNVARVEGPIMLDNVLKLGACGDWNMGGRVEGAFLSAHRMVESIRDCL